MRKTAFSTKVGICPVSRVPRHVKASIGTFAIGIQIDGARESSFRRQRLKQIGVDETSIIGMIDPVSHLAVSPYGNKFAKNT